MAEDGERALALAAARPPNVVLLDMNLPDLDGAEVYRQLRIHPETWKTHVLFLTAATSLDLYQRGIEAGVVLRKPFEMRELVDWCARSSPASDVLAYRLTSVRPPTPAPLVYHSPSIVARLTAGSSDTILLVK